MVKVRKPPRGVGDWGNGNASLQTDSLAAAGLVLVRHLSEHGKVIGETVIPADEIPEVCVASEPCPQRPCGACHMTAWRRDRGTGTSWICGRCHR